MKNILKKLFLASVLTLIMVIAIGVGVFINNKDNISEQIFSGVSNAAIDLIGTKTGTSTAGVGFRITGSGGQSATTTYPYFIGSDIDTAIYTLSVKNASSSANLTFSLLGSNDASCNTATTSPDYGNPILKQDINWFDIVDNLKGKVHSTSLAVATSTIVWDTSNSAGKGRELILTDLRYQCVALQVSGSSTAVWAQLATKQY